MSPHFLVKIRRYGLFAAAILSAGCATTGNGAEETFWQKMIPGDQAAAPAFPTPAPSKYLESTVQVKIGETPPPKKIKDPAKLNLAYGRWQEQIGQLAEARRSYDLVLKEEPKSVDAMLGIARLDQLGGRTREAETGFLNAAKLKPNDAHVADAVGQFYASTEKWPEAIRWTESALNMAKAAPLNTSEVSSIEFHLATVKARSGDLPGSLPHFVKSVGEAEGHYNIGYILYERGQTAAAALEFERALAIRPDLAQAQSMLDEIRAGQAGVQQTSAMAPRPQSAFRPAKLEVSSETRPAATIPHTPLLSLPQNGPQHLATRPSQPSGQGVILSADFGGNTAERPTSSPQQEQWRNQFGAGHQQ